MALEPKKITPRIYQGGWLRPEHIPELVQLGITHILNLDLPSTDPLPLSEASITLHNVTVEDHRLMRSPLVQEVMEVIDRTLSFPGHKIYIHCVEGVNRSPTVAWLYLIHTGLSPEEATSIIKPNQDLYNKSTVEQLISNRPSSFLDK